MAGALMPPVSTGALVEHTLDDVAITLRELAEGAAGKAREKQAEGEIPRKHGMRRREHLYWNGYLHGVSAAIAAVTGEQTEQILWDITGVQTHVTEWKGF